MLQTTRVMPSSIVENKRKQKKCENAELVKELYLQDVNSTPTAGKRETIMRKKVKMQKRYLCDTLLNLYDKFKSEHPGVDVSYTIFTRLMPFYVVTPSVHQRDTVKCKLHHYCEFKAIKLHTLGVQVHER